MIHCALFAHFVAIHPDVVALIPTPADAPALVGRMLRSVKFDRDPGFAIKQIDLHLAASPFRHPRI